MMLARFTSWYGALALGLLLVAAGSCADEEDAGKPMTPVTTAPKAAAVTDKPADANAGPAAPTYNPVGKRDPFRSYLAELREAGEAEFKRRIEPTEAYELEQYRLTGLVTGTSQPKAMVEDPTGKGHAVKVGTHLGRGGGIVTRIMSTGIVVTQETRSPTGERVRVPVTISLPQPELELGNEQ